MNGSERQETEITKLAALLVGCRPTARMPATLLAYVFFNFAFYSSPLFFYSSFAFLLLCF